MVTHDNRPHSETQADEDNGYPMVSTSPHATSAGPRRGQSEFASDDHAFAGRVQWSQYVLLVVIKGLRAAEQLR
jgi:hypothetical protein